MLSIQIKNGFLNMLIESFRVLRSNKYEFLLLILFVLSTIGFDLYFSDDFSALSKIILVFFFAFNISKLEKGVELMIEESVNDKNIDLVSFLIVFLEIAFALIFSLVYLDYMVNDFVSLLLIMLLFAQHLNYVNNEHEFKEEKSEKERRLEIRRVEELIERRKKERRELEEEKVKLIKEAYEEEIDIRLERLDNKILDFSLSIEEFEKIENIIKVNRLNDEKTFEELEKIKKKLTKVEDLIKEKAQ